MNEQNKQVDDQEKKAAGAKEHQEKHVSEKKNQSEQKQAGMATDPEAMQDKGYQKRMDEKTSKH